MKVFVVDHEQEIKHCKTVSEGRRFMCLRGKRMRPWVMFLFNKMLKVHHSLRGKL